MLLAHCNACYFLCLILGKKSGCCFNFQIPQEWLLGKKEDLTGGFTHQRQLLSLLIIMTIKFYRAPIIAGIQMATIKCCGMVLLSMVELTGIQLIVTKQPIKIYYQIFKENFMARSLSYKQRFQGYWRVLFKRSCKLWCVAIYSSQLATGVKIGHFLQDVQRWYGQIKAQRMQRFHFYSLSYAIKELMGTM